MNKSRNGRIGKMGMAILLVSSLMSLAWADPVKTKEPPIPSDESLGFFGNSRDEVIAQIKRVALLPVMLPGHFGDRSETQQQIEALVIRYLEQAGFSVIASDHYKSLYDKMNVQLGGIYDPTTGELKAEQMKALRANSLQQLVMQDRLNGYVVARIVTDSTRYSYGYAQWLGVRERVDGKQEPSSAVERFFDTQSVSGNVPVISLVVQIFNTQGRVVYGRLGGIQLLAYLGVNEFLDVPTDRLLRDSARLERAVQVATMPLTHTPSQIAYGDDDPSINLTKSELWKLPEPPSAEKEKKTSPFGTNRDQMLAQVHRVAISRVAVGGGLAVPEEVRAAFLSSVRQELSKLGWDVVDVPNAHEILIDKIHGAKIFDPYTGKRNEQLLNDARKSVLDELKLDKKPDAMIWLSVKKTVVQHKGGDVEWDGANQSGLDLGPVRQGFWKGSFNGMAGNGAVSATSFNVFVADADSNRLYESAGGVELLQKLDLKVDYRYGSQTGRATPVDRAPSELFQDASRINASVHNALRELVMTPEELDAELHPKKKK